MTEQDGLQHHKSPDGVIETKQPERRPATEAGRAHFAKYHNSQDATDDILAIEAQATDARVATLVEALGLAEAIMNFDPYKSTSASTAYDDLARLKSRYKRLLSDLPAAAAERPLDVERLARALAAAKGFEDFTPWASERDAARVIAAEYARLSESDR